MELLPLSTFIDQQNEFITINDNQEYTRVTTKLHGKGVVLRDVVKGFEIKTKRQQLCKANQLLVAEIDAKVGGYGIVPKELEGSIVSSHYFLFNINPVRLLPEYLSYVLKTASFFSQIKAQGSTNYAAIRPRDVLKIMIPYSNLDLQKNVVKELSSVTAKNTHLSKNILREKDYISLLRKTILQEAVSGKLVPQDPNDEPASVLLEKVKTEKETLAQENRIKKEKTLPPISQVEESYEVPKGWVWVRLGDLCDIINGRAYKMSELLSSGTPVLRVGNLFTSEKWYYSDLELNPDKYCEKGDLLFAWSASFGPFIWQGERSIFHYHIWKIRHSKYVERRYLYNFLLQQTNLIKSGGHGITMSHMTKEKMELRLVPLPPLKEQARIIEKADRLMELCENLENSLAKNQKNSEFLMDTVLKEAFEA